MENNIVRTSCGLRSNRIEMIVYDETGRDRDVNERGDRGPAEQKGES